MSSVKNKSIKVIAFQAELIERIPENVSDSKRMAITESIERFIDSTESDDTNLRWRLQNGFQSDSEPPSHEVIAMSLCFKSGEIEGPVREAQLGFYAKHPGQIDHLVEWTLQGLIDKPKVRTRTPANRKPAGAKHDNDNVEAKDNNGTNDEDVDEIQEIAPFAANISRRGKRKASEIGHLSDGGLSDRKSKQLKAGTSLTHVPSDDTPRLNQLFAAQASPEPDIITAPAPPAVLMSTRFSRVPGANQSPTPRISSPSGAEALAEDLERAARKEMSPDNKTASNSAKLKINTLHRQALDKLAHAEALHKEQLSVRTMRPVTDSDTMEKLCEHIGQVQDLNTRIAHCHEGAIGNIGEAVLTQGDQMMAALEKIDQKIAAMQKVMLGLSTLARQEITRNHSQGQDSIN